MDLIRIYDFQNTELSLGTGVITGAIDKKGAKLTIRIDTLNGEPSWII